MCIFCKIVSGELPSYQVYEDEQALAFLDIKPVNPGHTLVILKEHYENMEAVPTAALGVLMAAVKKVGALLKTKLGFSGYNISENNDPVAGQIVPHLHFHVIPRRAGDGLKLWPQGEYAPGAADEIIQKLTR